MITDLTQAFKDKLELSSRSPVQIVKFTLTDSSEYFLGDRLLHFGTDIVYPWIEDWGTLSDSVNLNSLFTYESIEARTTTLTIIISKDTADFIDKLQEQGIENTTVDLYQSFEGLDVGDWALIDRMVCQDPIEFTEASMLLSIDLVSIIMKNNPYLYARDPDEHLLPVVLGRASNIPLVDLQTARWTSLVVRISDGADGEPTTGEFLISNGIGFPATGLMYIDSEIVSYDSITASDINITGRALEGTSISAHQVGARLTIPNANYDYSICSGPVESVTDLIANGEPYVNPVTLLIGQSRVTARFVHRPPWLKVSVTEGPPTSPPDETLDGQFGLYTGSTYGNGAQAPTGVSNINQQTESVSMHMADTVEGGWKYNYYLSCTLSNTVDALNNVYSVTASRPGGWETMLAYAITRRSVEGDYLSAPPTYHADGTVGYVDYALNASSPPVGITSIANPRIVTGSFHRLSAIQSDVRGKFSYVSDSGTVTALSDDTVLNYGGYISKTITKDGNFNINASSINDLINGSVRVEMESVASNLDGTFTPSGEVRGEVTNLVFDYFTSGAVAQEPWQNVVSRFGADLSDLGTLVGVYITTALGSTGDCEGTIDVVKRSTSSPNDNVVIASAPLFTTYYSPRIQVLNSGNTWQDLVDMRVGIQSQITGPTAEGTKRNMTVYVSWVKWEIEYTPTGTAGPDEERISYAEDVTCTVTSVQGADVTPPDAIRSLINKYVPNGETYIDATSFDALHQEYLLNSYFLNGVVGGGMRLHEALKKVMYEGMLRLLFSEGKIKLISYSTDYDLVVDAVVIDSDTLIRSAKKRNQPITTVKNFLSILYNRNLALEKYEGTEEVFDTLSIEQYKRQEYRQSFDLIDSEETAKLIADRTLYIFKNPIDIYEIDVFMNIGFVLEKGDRIRIRSFNNKKVHLEGVIVATKRRFASGKNNLMNVYTLSLSHTYTFDKDGGYGGEGYGEIGYGY